MTTAQLSTRVPCTSGAPTTSTGIRSALASTISAIARCTPSSRVSWRNRSSIEYPVSDSSGNTATATWSSWHLRASASTAEAFAAGSATVTGSVHAATRAKPCAYAE
jgi:hypothetical protein